MYRKKIQSLSMLPATDQKRLHIIRRDISGGANTRQHGRNIGENQSILLYNVDLGILGESSKRLGTSLIEDLGNDAGTSAFGFEPIGGTNELLVTHGTKLEGYTGSGTFTEHDTGFTTNLQTSIIKVYKSGSDGDVVMIQNGTDNAHEMKQDHTVTDLTNDNDDPPKSLVNLFFRGRWWIQKDNELFWSSAYPSDYAGSFNRTTDAYKIPVGKERFMFGIRDTGIIIGGNDGIYGINPAVTPAATDKSERLLDIGCVANKSAVAVGDDIFFLASDGVRGLFRTIQDKLQLGESFPLSFPLKTEYDTINWSAVNKACAVYFDNKFFLALPTSSSSYNNQVWVYYPAIKSWMVITGWNVGAWAKVKFSGEEKLYYIDSNDGSVYQAWTGYTDNTSAINYQEESRKEVFNNPHLKKRGEEIKISAKANEDIDISVYAQFDDNGWNLLGTFNVLGNAITFPITFPVSFKSTSIAYKKFHLDFYGSWYHMQWKIKHNATNTKQVSILERYVSAFLDELDTEEEA